MEQLSTLCVHLLQPLLRFCLQAPHAELHPGHLVNAHQRLCCLLPAGLERPPLCLLGYEQLGVFFRFVIPGIDLFGCDVDKLHFALLQCLRVQPVDVLLRPVIIKVPRFAYNRETIPEEGALQADITSQ